MSKMRVRHILRCLFATQAIQAVAVIRSSDMLRNAGVDGLAEAVQAPQDLKAIETPMVMFQSHAAQPVVESSEYERAKTALNEIVDQFKFGDMTLLQTGNQINPKTTLCNQGKGHDCLKPTNRGTGKKLVGLVATVLAGVATPEVVETVSAMVAHLQTGALAKIKEDHNDSQAKLNADLEDLKTTTEDTVHKWHVAVGHDTSWLECVAEERALLQEVETCRITEEDLLQDKLTKCNYSSNMSKFQDSSPRPDLSFICDFKNDDCVAGLSALKENFDHWFEALGNKVAQDNQQYINVTQACDAATKDYQNKVSDCNGKQEAFSNKQIFCERKKTIRSVAMCVFGDELQAKCKAKQVYDNSVDRIDGNGTIYSDSERRSEWHAVSTIVCMLNKFKAQGFFTKAEMAVCESSLDYDTNVGTLNKKGEIYQHLIGPENFTCGETHITFNGSLWTVPDGENTNSSQYNFALRTFPVNTSDGSQAFSFCNEGDNGPNCSTFSACPATLTRGDDATICQLASGCSIADCCVPVCTSFTTSETCPGRRCIWMDSACHAPTLSPTDAPTESPTLSPTDAPTEVPTASPTSSPTSSPTYAPTDVPTDAPSEAPTESPTSSPTSSPTELPTSAPTSAPSEAPTESPTSSPTSSPTDAPTEGPTTSPTSSPTSSPTDAPSEVPTDAPSEVPTEAPTESPTSSPTSSPTWAPARRRRRRRAPIRRRRTFRRVEANGKYCTWMRSGAVMATTNDVDTCSGLCTDTVGCTRFYVCTHHAFCGLCNDASRQKSDPHCTLYSTNSTKVCPDVLKLDGANPPHTHLNLGNYTMMGSINLQPYHQGMPIYKQTVGNVYLYFWGEYKEWRLGTNYTRPNSNASSGNMETCLSLCPTSATRWFQWTGASWQLNAAITVSAAHRRRHV